MGDSIGNHQKIIIQDQINLLYFHLDKQSFIFYILLQIKNFFIQRIKMMTITRLNRKHIFFFFAILFLFASLVITFHHHDDGCEHHECPLCVAASSFSSGNLEIHETFAFYPTTTYLHQPEESFHQALSKFSIYSDRAPPVSVPV